MEIPTILHLMTTAKNLSPFDVNLAHDAGWTHCAPYTHVTLEEVTGLVHDAIFSRRPKDGARTGIFLGGRDLHLALDMLEAARAAMVPPFAVSVFADPSGAVTTAAAMVAAVESRLRADGADGLAGQRVLIFGGSGPVGSATAILAARAGARTTIVDVLDGARAAEAANHCNRRHGVDLGWADGSTEARLLTLLAEADALVNASAAGVRILRKHQIAAAARLKVAADANAVPPAGIDGIAPQDRGVPLPASPSGAVGLGALAIGAIKYRVQLELLAQMHATGAPRYLGLDEALETARRHVG